MPEDVVFVSLRDYEKEEKTLIEKHGMRIVTTSELRRKGVEIVYRSIIRSLSDCTDIYVSFDVDDLPFPLDCGVVKLINCATNNRLSPNHGYLVIEFYRSVTG